MDHHERTLRRNMLLLWGIIALVLFVSYLGEVLKGQRTLAYFAAFSAVTLLPLAFCCWLHQTDRLWAHFPEIMVGCYFFMYAFVLLTGSTTMVFSYILPMLSFMVLCHRSRLVLWAGVASLALNLASIGVRLGAGEITLTNSKDVEIQVALIVLCFTGVWVSSRMYDRITRDNEAYLQKVLAQSEQITTQEGMLTEMRSDMENITRTARIDPLTGISNRLAYEEWLGLLAEARTVGVVYCDVNGLKYRNDHNGHEAGDRLLVEFAETLTDYYRRQDCFRISGDEFVVILTDADEDLFRRRATKLHRRLWSQDPPMAATGWAFGGNVTEMVKQAEKAMYLDKQAFYEKFPAYRR